jgi:hypothetical protein
LKTETDGKLNPREKLNPEGDQKSGVLRHFIMSTDDPNDKGVVIVGMN